MTKEAKIKLAIIIVGLIYIVFMFLKPLFNGVLMVALYQWQALNVGIIALASSILFFKATQIKEEKERSRKFVAAKALLPQALSEITSYNKSAALIWVEAISKVREHDFSIFNNCFPEIPTTIHPIIKECISQANANIGEYLAGILSDLQVQHSRLSGLKEAQRMRGYNIPHLQSCLKQQAYLQAKINQLFNFARGLEGFDDSKLNEEKVKTAINNIIEPSNEREKLVRIYCG